MNILLACNDISKKKLTSIIKSQFDKATIVAVCDKKSYDDLKFKSEKFEQAFIFVELDWFTDNTINQGYDLAINFMNRTEHQKKHIQVRFFSLNKQSDLIKNVSGNKFFLAKSFQHIYILGGSQAVFDEYSLKHFEFIKLFSLTESGILLYVKHEVSRIANELSNKDDEFVNQKNIIKSHIRSLLFLKNQTNSDLFIDISSLNKDEMKVFLTNFLIKLDLLTLKGFVRKSTEKLPYSVLIVEDNPVMLRELVAICKEHFTKVYPSTEEELKSYTVNNAFEILDKKGNDYQIMIIDLLFERRDASYELISGIDFLDLARTKHPFLTTRVVTNVSKQIIAPLINLPIKDLYPKNMGKEALSEFINNDIDRIKEECLEKENSKKTTNVGPKIGLFGTPGFWDQIENLITTNTFDVFWKDSALKNFNEFKSINKITNFDGELLSSKDKKKKNYSTAEIERCLKTILTYRLLFLDYIFEKLDNNSNQKICIDRDGSEGFIEILKSVSDRKSFRRKFLSDIGITNNELEHKIITKKNGELGSDWEKLEIRLINLFPQEVVWLLPKIKAFSDDLIIDKHPKLAQWLEKFREDATFCYDINLLDYVTLGNLLDEIINSGRQIIITKNLEDQFYKVDDYIGIPKEIDDKLTKFGDLLVDEDDVVFDS